MSWRTVVVRSRAKIDLKMNYIVICGGETRRIHISEVAVLMIESTAVSLTAGLLAELTRNKVKVIFCDEKRCPSSELVPYYGSHDSSGRVREQINWKQNTKDNVWTEIVSEKIHQQSLLLKEMEHSEQAALLQEYGQNVQIADATNREGHAAKVYFNALFGMDFTRNGENATNAALDYGYTILLSAFSREITAAGYLTQMGINHRSRFNHFNFASDLMEPFRPLVDRRVLQMDPENLEHEEKMHLVNTLNEPVVIKERKQTVLNAIGIYCKSVFDALNNDDAEQICFYRYEL